MNDHRARHRAGPSARRAATRDAPRRPVPRAPVCCVHPERTGPEAVTGRCGGACAGSRSSVRRPALELPMVGLRGRQARTRRSYRGGGHTGGARRRRAQGDGRAGDVHRRSRRQGGFLHSAYRACCSSRAGRHFASGAWRVLPATTTSGGGALVTSPWSWSVSAPWQARHALFRFTPAAPNPRREGRGLFWLRSGQLTLCWASGPIIPAPCVDQCSFLSTSSCPRT